MRTRTPATSPARVSCCLRLAALRRSSACSRARSTRARRASRFAAVAAFASAVLCEVFFCAIEGSFFVGPVIGVGLGIGIGGREQDGVERQPGAGSYDEPQAQREQADVA